MALVVWFGSFGCPKVVVVTSGIDMLLKQSPTGIKEESTVNPIPLLEVEKIVLVFLCDPNRVRSGSARWVVWHILLSWLVLSYKIYEPLYPKTSWMGSCLEIGRLHRRHFPLNFAFMAIKGSSSAQCFPLVWREQEGASPYPAICHPQVDTLRAIYPNGKSGSQVWPSPRAGTDSR